MPPGLSWIPRPHAEARGAAESVLRVLLALVLALGCAWASGCAAAGSDIHLAPLWTRMATADGGTVIEAAGGIYRQHRRDEGDFLQWRTLAPLYGIQRWRNGDWVAEHPFLFGRTRSVAGELTSYVVPFYLGWKRLDADGTPRSLWFTIVGLTRQRDGDEIHGGWFPFYGHYEDILTFDDARWVLWPLWVRADRSGRVSHHVLWPFFGWTTGGDERSWHVFPLAARSQREDRYDRVYVLWPFFHWQRNFLGGGGEEPEKVWWFWPFHGHKERGTYDAWTWFWPLFGYARDPRSGFWALDFPFFLVRIQRGPDDVRRTRFWPFYSHLEAGGLESTNYLWPIVHLRHEDSPAMERDSVSVVPFWQSWDRRDKATGETSSWRKLWPLFRHERQGEWRSGALLDLDPFFRNDLVTRHVTGFFRLYEWEEEPDYRRERSFLGLYRRERGRGEDRRSLSGLWASRRYAAADRAVRETSLLFGLVRWRVTADEGFDMLPPAFPGPGWARPVEPARPGASRTYF
jgi:hypothetical protein